MNSTAFLDACSVDLQLEKIIESAVERMQSGESVELAALAAAHPEYAEQLRELLPLAALMVRMGTRAHDASAAEFSVAGDRRGGEDSDCLGDFRIIRRLGRGGMGTVYEAEQISMGRRVALKVLPFAPLADDKLVQRFRNEVRAIAALDHPNIVAVFSVGEDRGTHFFAMQLVRGQSLADWIETQRTKRACASDGRDSSNPSADKEAETIRDEQAQCSTVAERPVSPDRHQIAAQLVLQAADALQHAHDQGILHRDVKPSNLLVDRNGRLYVSDFGLARMSADVGLTMTGDILGTLRYMPPEQALAKRPMVDRRCDIYSLGATLYELATLRPAYDESDRVELLKQIAFGNPRRPRKIDPSVPAGLERIILKAMARSPEERYVSMRRFADDLRAFLEGRPVAARSPGVVRSVAQRISAKRGTITAACVLLLTMSWFAWPAKPFYPVEAKRLMNELRQEQYETIAKEGPKTSPQVVRRAHIWADDADRLAWMLVTSETDDMRNGSLALELAQHACAITHYCDAPKLSTLAGACAEIGDFEAAVRWAAEAARLEPERNSHARQLHSYLNRKPLRE